MFGRAIIMTLLVICSSAAGQTADNGIKNYLSSIVNRMHKFGAPVIFNRCYMDWNSPPQLLATLVLTTHGSGGILIISTPGKRIINNMRMKWSVKDHDWNLSGIEGGLQTENILTYVAGQLIRTPMKMVLRKEVNLNHLMSANVAYHCSTNYSNEFVKHQLDFPLGSPTLYKPAVPINHH